MTYSTDYEEQESIEYEQETSEQEARERLVKKWRRIGKGIGGCIAAVLIALLLLLVTAGGWSLILGTLGVSTEGWTIRDWAYLVIGTHLIAIAMAYR